MHAAFSGYQSRVVVVGDATSLCNLVWALCSKFFVRAVRALSLTRNLFIISQLDNMLFCIRRFASMVRARRLSQSLDPASPHTFVARSIKRRPGETGGHRSRASESSAAAAGVILYRRIVRTTYHSGLPETFCSWPIGHWRRPERLVMNGRHCISSNVNERPR